MCGPKSVCLTGVACSHAFAAAMPLPSFPLCEPMTVRHHRTRLERARMGVGSCRHYAEEAFSFHVQQQFPGTLRILDMQDMHALRQGAAQHIAPLMQKLCSKPARLPPIRAKAIGLQLHQ